MEKKVVNKNFFNTNGFLGALLANLLSVWSNCSNPIGSNIKKTGHHTTKKNIIISKAVIKLLLTLLKFH